MGTELNQTKISITGSDYVRCNQRLNTHSVVLLSKSRDYFKTAEEMHEE
jgi:hypothetical protein